MWLFSDYINRVMFVQILIHNTGSHFRYQPFPLPSLWAGQVVNSRIILSIVTHCSNLFQLRRNNGNYSRWTQSNFAAAAVTIWSRTVKADTNVDAEFFFTFFTLVQSRTSTASRFNWEQYFRVQLRPRRWCYIWFLVSPLWNLFRIEYAHFDDDWKVRLLLRKFSPSAYSKNSDFILPKKPCDFTFNETIECLKEILVPSLLYLMCVIIVSNWQKGMRLLSDLCHYC